MEQRYVILITKSFENVCIEYELAKQLKNLNISMGPVSESQTNVKFVKAYGIDCAILKRLISWLKTYHIPEEKDGIIPYSPQEILKQFCEEHKNLDNETMMDLASGATYLGLNVIVYMLKYLMKQKLRFRKSNKQTLDGDRNIYTKHLAGRSRLHKIIEPAIPSAEERITLARDQLRADLCKIWKYRERTLTETNAQSGDINILCKEKNKAMSLQKLRHLQPSQPQPLEATQKKANTSINFQMNYADNFMDISNNGIQNHFGVKHLVKNDNNEEGKAKSYDYKTDYKKCKSLNKCPEKCALEEDDLESKLKCTKYNKAIRTNVRHRNHETDISDLNNQERDSKSKQLTSDTNSHSNYCARVMQFLNLNKDDQKRREECYSLNREEQKLESKIKGILEKANPKDDAMLTNEPNSSYLNNDIEAYMQHQRDDVKSSFNEHRTRNSKLKVMLHEATQCQVQANKWTDSHRCDESKGHKQLQRDEASTNAYEDQTQYHQFKKKSSKKTFPTDTHSNNEFRYSDCHAKASNWDNYCNKKYMKDISMIAKIKDCCKWSINELSTGQTQSATHTVEHTHSKQMQTDSLVHHLVQTQQQKACNEYLGEDSEEILPVDILRSKKLGFYIKCVCCESTMRISNIERTKKETNEIENGIKHEAASSKQVFKQSAERKTLKTQLPIGVEFQNIYGVEMDSLVDIKRINNAVSSPPQITVSLQTDCWFNSISATVQTEALWLITSSTQTDCLFNAVSTSVQTQIFWHMTSSSQTDHWFNVVSASAQTEIFCHTTSSAQTDICCNTVGTSTQTETPSLMMKSTIETYIDDAKREIANETHLQQIPSFDRGPTTSKFLDMSDDEMVEHYYEPKYQYQTSSSNSDCETPFTYSTHNSKTTASTSCDAIPQINFRDISEDDVELTEKCGNMGNNSESRDSQSERSVVHSTHFSETIDSTSYYETPHAEASNAIETTVVSDGLVNDSDAIRSQSEIKPVNSIHISEIIDSTSRETPQVEGEDNFQDAVAAKDAYDGLMNDILFEIELMKFD